MEPKNYASELLLELTPAIQAYLDRTPELELIEVDLSYKATDGNEGQAVKDFDLKSSDR